MNQFQKGKNKDASLMSLVAHYPGRKSFQWESFWRTMKIRLDGFKNVSLRYSPMSLCPQLGKTFPNI